MTKEQRCKYQADYRKNNPEKTKEYQKTYRKNNPEKIREYKQKWYKENRELAVATSIKSHNKHREKRLAYQKSYRLKNLSKEKAIKLNIYWPDKTPDEALAAFHNLVDSQNNKCAICSNPPKTKSLHVDHNHLTKKVRGLLCTSCNLALGYLKADINDELLIKAISYLKSKT